MNKYRIEYTYRGYPMKDYSIIVYARNDVEAVKKVTNNGKNIHINIRYVYTLEV